MMTVDSYNFSGKKAIMRVDFNVPLNADFEVTDDTRVRAAIPSIKKILADGGSPILMSHLGRPKEGPEEKFSLKHVIKTLSGHLGTEVKFAPDCIGEETLEMKKSLKPGEVLLLENLRFYKEETKGDETFAAKLAEGADVYVNDACGTAHRAHASTTIVAKFFEKDKVFGYLINNELSAMDKVLKQPEHPFTAIMGGAKVSDKILVIENLLDKVDNLIIGGGMTYTFIKAQGGEIGNSLCEEDKLDMALDIIKKAEEKGVNLVLPVDQVLADKFDNEANTETAEINAGKEGMMGLDIADKTIELYSDVIMNSKTILWNGPMGVFEMENFRKGTISIAKAIAEATEKGAFSLVGGGDSALETAILTSDYANSVALSYRKDNFARAKEGNVERIEQLSRSGKVKLLLESNVTSIEEEKVTLTSSQDEQIELKNDSVYTMIGRELPVDFFKKSNIKMEGELSLTAKLQFLLLILVSGVIYFGKSSTDLFKYTLGDKVNSFGEFVVELFTLEFWGKFISIPFYLLDTLFYGNVRIWSVTKYINAIVAYIAIIGTLLLGVYLLD
jgi:phosphoglycerate kinase